MWSERSLLTIAIAIVLVVLLGFVRLPERWIQTGVSSEQIWTVKAHWPRIFDVVLVGDSRIGQDVSPSAMAEIMPGYRIGNFSYPNCALIEPYLRAAEEKLDPFSAKKMIILGVAPASLTSWAASANSFLDEQKRRPFDVVARMYFGEVLSFFRPITLRSIWDAVRGTQPDAQLFQEFHSDGWVASTRVPQDPRAALPFYEELFRRHKISPHVSSELLRMVDEWATKRIRVVAFRPPTTPEMVAIETRVAEFDEKSFVERFEAAGGTWLSFESGRYHSYDGSHLDRDAARQFSKDLATRLLNQATHDELPAK